MNTEPTEKFQSREDFYMNVKEGLRVGLSAYYMEGWEVDVDEEVERIISYIESLGEEGANTVYLQLCEMFAYDYRAIGLFLWQHEVKDGILIPKDMSAYDIN